VPNARNDDDEVLIGRNLPDYRLVPHFRELSSWPQVFRRGVGSHGYHTPVSLLPLSRNEKRRTRALENGAVGFLTKPFDERLLIECLTTAIKLRPFMGALHTKVPIAAMCEPIDK
jgi:CheY-like chemotaxis protein